MKMNSKLKQINKYEQATDVYEYDDLIQIPLEKIAYSVGTKKRINSCVKRKLTAAERMKYGLKGDETNG